MIVDSGGWPLSPSPEGNINGVHFWHPRRGKKALLLLFLLSLMHYVSLIMKVRSCIADFSYCRPQVKGFCIILELWMKRRRFSSILKWRTDFKIVHDCQIHANSSLIVVNKGNSFEWYIILLQSGILPTGLHSISECDKALCQVNRYCFPFLKRFSR